MSEQQPQTKRAPQRRMGAGVVAGLAVLVAFVALGISIYGLIKQTATASLEIQLPCVIAAGGGITIASIIAMIRSKPRPEETESPPLAP
ncbi:MAG: hypothetical protein K2Y27_08875 [Xanthobacteraceae bacterium]|nr:hypothetical protein [Xanthobacteraceae bacterium]